MKRIRSNRRGLYPTGKPEKAGYEDLYFEVTCSGCGEIIQKSESNITTHKKGIIKKYHWDCVPDLKNTYKE